MALKPKHKGENPNDIKTEMVEDLDVLVPRHHGKDSNDIRTEMVTERKRREEKSRHKEYR